MFFNCVLSSSSVFQAKQVWITDYLKRLKICIKWFQKSLQNLATEKDNLRNMLDASDRKCVEAGYIFD